MKKLVLGALLSSMSSLAMGNCWNECVMLNPITGSCVQKIRICDVENPSRAAADFSEGIRKGAGQLVQEWHNLWGTIPDPLKTFLEQYPLTIASIISPDTRAYTLAIAAIEDYYNRAKRRSNDIAEIEKDAPQWKVTSLRNGLRAILLAEGMVASEGKYTAETYVPIHDKNEGPWQEFLSCERAAENPDAASTCVSRLSRQLFERMVE